MKTAVLTTIFSGALILVLGGCATTRIELGAKPGDVIENAQYTGLLEGPVDLKSRCGGVKPATITLSRGILAENVDIGCSAAAPKSVKR
jgi:hypothetical protein